MQLDLAEEHLGRLRLGEEVDDALGVGGDRAGRLEIRVEQAGVDDPPPAADSSRSRTRPKSRSWDSGFVL